MRILWFLVKPFSGDSNIVVRSWASILAAFQVHRGYPHAFASVTKHLEEFVFFAISLLAFEMEWVLAMRVHQRQLDHELTKEV
jgi:hypothetical protein